MIPKFIVILYCVIAVSTTALIAISLLPSTYRMAMNPCTYPREHAWRPIIGTAVSAIVLGILWPSTWGKVAYEKYSEWGYRK